MSDTKQAEGSVVTTSQTRTTLAPIWRLLQNVVKSLPTYKDSKRGRQNAMQIKFALMAIGIACIAFGGSNAWVAAGVAICIVPLLVPLEAGKRTTWISSLKRMSSKTSTKKRAGTITREKNRVTLESGSDRWQMSTKKKVRRLVMDDRALIGFRDGDGDRVWFRTDEIPEQFPERTPEDRELFRVMVDVDADVFEWLNE